MRDLLLDVKGLRKQYPIWGSLGRLLGPADHINAVAGVSFAISNGETYGLVGESGCGKTTAGRTVLGLERADGGQILFAGRDLAKLSQREFMPLRRDIQLVYQDTLSSLNPRRRIGRILEEPLIIHKIGSSETRKDLVLDILNKVGLSQEHYFRYPHELSGGQVQRLGMARALIIKPKLVICDEPVSALDVSIQAQILNMLRTLKKELALSLLFISHDIGVVRYISDVIGVMYLGTIVEQAPTELLFQEHRHPYTKLLFSAIPRLGSQGLAQTSPPGEAPVHADSFRGCVFHTRCSYATDRCMAEAPTLQEISPGHTVACHLV
jgi:oligopeptide/dipeptide ABC transporter ATP-binding protein